MKAALCIALGIGMGATALRATAEIRCDALLRSSNQIEIGWTATAGQDYVVLKSPSPSGPWRDVLKDPPLLRATGNRLSQVFTRSTGSEFFRVLQVTVPSGMAYVPAGSFSMGDSFWEGPIADAVPPHPVYLSAFFMDTCETTKTLWDTVGTWALANGYSFDHAGSGKAPEHPVQTVSWFDAVKWCNARSEMEGLAPVYFLEASFTTVYRTGQGTPYPKWSAPGYRLPTEAEWEKSARGGLSGKRFPWGDTISHAWANYWANTNYFFDVNPTSGLHPAYNDGVQPYTSPVGAFAPNGLGLYDVAGNVFEWCWDWYDAAWYAMGGAILDDTRGPVDPMSTRVLRGGAWVQYAPLSRCFARAYYAPDKSYSRLGLRCARSR